MNRTDREPLTPDERALADLLARDGGQSSPSAALDAAILAAAREAAMPAAPAPRVSALQAPPTRHRWPLAVGIAASLALAVGIAWQLRPGPGDEAPRARSEADMAAPAAARMMDEAAPAPSPQPESTPLKAPAPSQPEQIAPGAPASEAPVAAPAAAMDAEEAALTTRSQDARESLARDAVPAPAPTSATPASAGAVSAERRTALGAQAFPVAAPAPATAAAKAPASSAPPSPPAAMADTGARVATTSQARAQRAESQALLLESIEDVPDDIEPPATVDAPEVRAAWLARVRELLDAGRIAEARASLAEFHRRHPKAELPPDLRALLD